MARLETRAFSDPWPATAFRDLLGDLSLVAEAGGQVAGFVIARRAADEGEILDLAVDPAYRRRGIARELLAELLRRLAAGGAVTVFLEVRASNLPALHLYAGLGFHEVGRRAGYYHAPAEDALVLACPLSADSGRA